MLYRVGALQVGAAGRGVPRARRFQKVRRRGGDVLLLLQAVRPGGALRVPHGRRLWRVARHGVAGAGAVLRGKLAVFHDLLQFRPSVLEPDFDLERKKKAGP